MPLNYLRARELCESQRGRPGLPIRNRPYGLCGEEELPVLCADSSLSRFQQCLHPRHIASLETGTWEREIRRSKPGLTNGPSTEEMDRHSDVPDLYKTPECSS